MNTQPLEDALGKTSSFQVSAHARSLALSAAIQGVYEIYTARLAYWQKIINVLSTNQDSEMLKDFVKNFSVWKVLPSESAKDAQDFSEKVRTQILKELKAVCEQFEERLNTINQSETDQNLVDALYYSIRMDRFLSKQHVSHHHIALTKKNKLSGDKRKLPKKPKIAGVDAWDLTDWDECLSLLEPVISAGEKAFMQDSQLLDTDNGWALQITHSTPHFKKLWHNFCNILIIIPPLFVPEIAADSLRPIYWKEFIALRAELHRLRDLTQTPMMNAEQWRNLIYHPISQNIDRFNILKENLETLVGKYKPIKQPKEVENIEAAPAKVRRRRPKKAGKQVKIQSAKSPSQSVAVPASVDAAETQASSSAALAQDQATALQNTISQLNSVAENSGPVFSTPHHYHQLKTEEWKAIVGKRRQEKAKQNLVEKKEKNEILQEASNRNGAALERLAKIKMQMAFILLKPLNGRHLEILTQIHHMPTPHLEIPYSEILTLFNGEADSLGMVTENAGGSHKKITIRGTLGYFDRRLSTEAISPRSPNEEDSKSLKETVGATFKPHRKNSVGKTDDKLPRVAVEMIRETLDRANITGHHLNLFLNVLRKIKKTQSGVEISIDCMMQMAEDIQVQLLFCLAANDKPRYGTSLQQQSSLVALQSNPDPTAKFGDDAQQKIMTKIFAYSGPARHLL